MENSYELERDYRWMNEQTLKSMKTITIRVVKEDQGRRTIAERHFPYDGFVAMPAATAGAGFLQIITGLGDALDTPGAPNPATVPGPAPAITDPPMPLPAAEAQPPKPKGPPVRFQKKEVAKAV